MERLIIEPLATPPAFDEYDVYEDIEPTDAEWSKPPWFCMTEPGGIAIGQCHKCGHSQMRAEEPITAESRLYCGNCDRTF